MINSTTLLLVFIGGGIGSICRFSIGHWAAEFSDKIKFPVGTLIVNTLACIILGFILFTYKEKIAANEWLKYLVAIGFCGGFSTFSTFSHDTAKLFQADLFLIGIFNILSSVILGIVILWLFIRA